MDIILTTFTPSLARRESVALGEKLRAVSNRFRPISSLSRSKIEMVWSHNVRLVIH